METDLEPDTVENVEDFCLNLTSMYNKSDVSLHFNSGNTIKLITENIELAGNLIQSLATFLNMENLQVIHH